MAQPLPTLIPPAQLSVSEKSPVAVIEDTFNCRLPVLLKSNVREAELSPTVVDAKVKLLDADAPRPISPMPMPVMTCGEVEEPSVTVMVPERSPGDFGVKLTV